MMPEDIFQLYLKNLKQSSGIMSLVVFDEEWLKLEKQKADIIWDLMPKYYNESN